MSDIKAAAERLRQAPRDNGLPRLAPYTRTLTDLTTLADYALTLLDETAVDDSELIESGFSPITLVAEGFEGRMFRFGRVEIQMPEGFTTIDNNDIGTEWADWPVKIQTRGQLRLLLAALGAGKVRSE